MKSQKCAEKISLIFVGIMGLIEMIRTSSFFYVYVMPGRYKICSVLQGLFQKNTKLNLSIAHNIRVGRAAGFVRAQHVIGNGFFVLGEKIPNSKWNMQVGGHASRHGTIVS